MTHDPEDYWVDLVDRLFGRRDAGGRSYDRRSEPEILLHGRLARVELSATDSPADLFEAFLFKGIGRGAAPMWNRQLRSLLRLRALGHPGLPSLSRGRYDDGQQVAYAVTTLRGRDLADARHRWRPEEQLTALEQFTVLLDALSQLHSIGIQHRNIHLGAVRIFHEEEDDTRFRCQLSRFEVSGLVRGLMGKRSDPDDATSHQELRAMALTPPRGADRPRHLAGLAPELSPYLFLDTATLRTDTATTDVFGLGVIGWEWFCGQVKDVLPEAYAGLAGATDDPRPALDHLQQEMRRYLTRAPIPKQLAGVLRQMIERDPSSRCTAFQATAALTACWSAVRAATNSHEPERPRLLAYMPKLFGSTLKRQFEWIEHDPDTDTGRREVHELLERDLRRAELIHVPGGAKGLVRSTVAPETMRQAEWVLIGERALWFAGYLRVPRPDDPPDPHVMVVRFVLEKESWAAASLLRVLPRRLVGRVKLVPHKPGDPFHHDLSAHPSWEPFANPIRRPDRVHGREFLQSIDFLQEYQEILLRSRWYPYLRVDSANGVFVKHDFDRDLDRGSRDKLFNAYLEFPKARARLGDFVDSLGLNGAAPKVVLGADRLGRPSFRDGVDVEVLSQADRDVLKVSAGRDVVVPERGWLRSQEDIGTETQLDRQTRARRMLQERPGLIDQLSEPQAVDTALETVDNGVGAGLNGNARHIVRSICTVEPLYALQGPPGTGKSTVSTEAIVEYLKVQPYTRLLVSAQSNFALDSLAAKIIKKVLPQEVVVIRATSQSGEVKDELVAEYTIDKVRDRYKERIKQSVESQVSRSGADELTEESAEQKLLKQWLSTVDANVVELGDRLRRSAQITLATCSVSAQVLDHSRDGAAVFDWVLVEEAAKAWPNELLIPLVQGLRWTLIGDHRQLGAYRADDLERFLDHLAVSGTEEAQLHAGLKEQHIRFLNLFGSLFDGLRGTPDGTAPGQPAADEDPESRAARRPQPAARLVHQFRMHPDIAEVVGSAFYPLDEKDTRLIRPTVLDSSYVDDLEPRLTEPAYLVGRSVVWIDTSADGACTDTPSWSNDGEADLVVALAAQLRPTWQDIAEGTGSLAVLSPYRRQLNKIESRDARLKDRLHTVHSFQGREADQVIVSLVRHKKKGTDERSNLGFVAQDQLVNVMLSRARRLLVIVGNLDHFRSRGTRNWQRVVAGVEKVGTVVPAGQVRAEELRKATR